MKGLLFILAALIAPAALAQAPQPLTMPAVPAIMDTAIEGESIWPRLVQGMRLGGEERPEVRRFIAHYSANPAFFSTLLS